MIDVHNGRFADSSKETRRELYIRYRRITEHSLVIEKLGVHLVTRENLIEEGRGDDLLLK